MGRNQIILASSAMISRLRIGTSDSVTYRPRPGPVWSRAGVCTLAGLIAILFALGPEGVTVGDLRAALGHATGTSARILLLFAGLALLTPVCIGLFGVLMGFRQWRGMDCMTVTADRIRLAVMHGPSFFGAQWAEWSSLTEFVVAQRDMGVLGAMPCAKARIVGPGVSRNLRGKDAFVILAMFPQPIGDIADELNALRPRSPEGDAAAAMPVGAEPRAMPPQRQLKRLAAIVIGFVALKTLLQWCGAPVPH